MAKLYVRLACMNAGKTTELLQVAHNYEEKGLKVAVIKPGVDTKGNDSVVSRLGIKRKVDAIIGSDESIIDKLNLEGLSCILVDEAQFLTEKQIIELFIIANKYNVPVIAFGLKVNFKGELFEGSKALLEWGQDFEYLRNICDCRGCGKRATFNGRKVNGEFVFEGDEILIDGTDNKVEYVALCGEHYLDKVYLSDTRNQDAFQKVLSIGGKQKKIKM